MAEGDFVVAGTGTVSATGPGVAATASITATGCAANDDVVITPTNTVSDINGPFVFKVTGITTNAFTITMDRNQLPEDFTFSFIVFDAA